MKEKETTTMKCSQLRITLLWWLLMLFEKVQKSFVYKNCYKRCFFFNIYNFLDCNAVYPNLFVSGEQFFRSCIIFNVTVSSNSSNIEINITYSHLLSTISLFWIIIEHLLDLGLLSKVTHIWWPGGLVNCYLHKMENSWYAAAG